MLVLKIRLYENIFCSCIIYDFFVNITQIIVASSTKNYGLWPHLDDRYCAVTSFLYNLIDDQLWHVHVLVLCDPPGACPGIRKGGGGAKI